MERIGHYDTFEGHPDLNSQKSSWTWRNILLFTLGITVGITCISTIAVPPTSQNNAAVVTTSSLLSRNAVVFSAVPIDELNHLGTCDKNIELHLSFHDDEVQLMDYVPMAKASTPPKIELIGDEGLYTAIMVDVDAPKPEHPSHAPFLHYIVTNIRPQSKEQTVWESYYPVTPPEGTHRYITLLFCQEERIEKPEQELSRPSFDIVHFVKQFDLKLSRQSHIFVSRPN